MHHHAWRFTWVFIQDATQVLMLVWQALYQQSHPLSPTSVFLAFALLGCTGLSRPSPQAGCQSPLSSISVCIWCRLDQSMIWAGSTSFLLSQKPIIHFELPTE